MFKDSRLQELAATAYSRTISRDVEGVDFQGVLNSLLDPALQAELNIQLDDGTYGKICSFKLLDYTLGIGFLGLPELFYVQIIHGNIEQRSVPLKAYQVQSTLLSFCVQLTQSNLIRQSLTQVLEPE